MYEMFYYGRDYSETVIVSVYIFFYPSPLYSFFHLKAILDRPKEGHKHYVIFFVQETVYVPSPRYAVFNKKRVKFPYKVIFSERMADPMENRFEGFESLIIGDET